MKGERRENDDMILERDVNILNDNKSKWRELRESFSKQI